MNELRQYGLLLLDFCVEGVVYGVVWYSTVQYDTYNICTCSTGTQYYYVPAANAMQSNHI